MGGSEYGVRYDLVVGTPYQGSLTKEVPVGCAIRPHGAEFYHVKLWAFQRGFYLKRSERSGKGTRYTLYARKTDRLGAPSFENPVGTGFVSAEVEDCLEIHLRIPKARIFMSLYPSRSMEPDLE